MTAKSLKHKFQSAIADDTTQPNIVHPSNWNDDHDLWMGVRAAATPTDALINADHLTLVIVSTGGSPAALTLAAPSPGNMQLGWITKVINAGAGMVTITGSGATINGGASAVLYPRDDIEIRSQGTNDYIGMTKPASATTNAGSAGQGGKLLFGSGTALNFKPFRGNYIKHNGVLRQIPGGGIPGLGNTGVLINGTAGNLANSTVYLVFATVDSNGAPIANFVPLIAGTTHVPSTTPGNEGTEVLSVGGTENPAQTLLGIIRTTAAGQFQDTQPQRFVRSWFNEPALSGYNPQASAFSTTSSSYIELGSGVFRLEWVNFINDVIELHWNAVAGSATSVATNMIGSFALDGNVAANCIEGSWAYHQTYADNKFWDSPWFARVAPAEGYHFACAIANIPLGAGQWWWSTATAGNHSGMSMRLQSGKAP